MPRVSKVSKQETEKIIELVRNHPCLYDQKTAEYRDTGLQKNIWSSIALLMGREDMNGDAWKKEWKYRRDVYVKKRKEFREKKSGQKATTSKVPTNWDFYQTMAFLDPFTETNSTESSLPPLDVDESSASSMDDSASIASSTVRSQARSVISIEDQERQMSAPASVELSVSSCAGSFKPAATKQRKRVHLQGPADIDRALTELIRDHTETRQQVLSAAARDTPTRRTADQSFFDHCASRMEILPPQIRSTLKIQITQLFHNAENPSELPVPIMPLPGFAHVTHFGQHQDSELPPPAQQQHFTSNTYQY